MVYRMRPQRNRRVCTFVSIWLPLLLLALLGSFLLECLLDAPRRGEYAELVLVLALASALVAWLFVRAWGRAGWFEPEPPEYFLTVVEEGLLVEVPARGRAHYMPWKGFFFARRGNMLQLFEQGALMHILSLRGVPRARWAEIRARLREHMRKASAPAAPAAPGLPPLPTATLPPPRPVEASFPVAFANTNEQWQECLHAALRPGTRICALLMVMIAWFGFMAGAEVLSLESSALMALLYFFLAVFLLCKIARPGSRAHRRVPGRAELALTQHEYFELGAQGGWARLRLPAVETSRLLRLPHSLCLLQRHDATLIMLDPADPLPPPLAAYPVQPAPRNRLRVAVGTLLLLLGWMLGFACSVLDEDPTEAEIVFQAIAPEPDGEVLRSFAQSYYAHGKVLDTPVLTPCPKAQGEGLAGYLLCFTDSEPDPEFDDGSFHLAWVNAVCLHADGRVHDQESWAVRWCPCEAWFRYMEEDDAEEPW